MSLEEQHLRDHFRNDQEGGHADGDQQDQQLPRPVPLVAAHLVRAVAPGGVVEEEVGGEEHAHRHDGEDEDGDVLERQLVQEPHVCAALVDTDDPAPRPREAVQVMQEGYPVHRQRGEHTEGDVETLEARLRPPSELQGLPAVPSKQRDVEVRGDAEREEYLRDRCPLAQKSHNRARQLLAVLRKLGHQELDE